MAAAVSVYVKIVFLTLFLSQIQSEVAEIQLCANPKCNEPIARGKTTQNYSKNKEDSLSFGINSPVTIFSRAGESLFVEIHGKRGYVNKRFVIEETILVGESKLTKVPRTQSSSNGDSGLKNDGQATGTQAERQEAAKPPDTPGPLDGQQKAGSQEASAPPPKEDLAPAPPTLPAPQAVQSSFSNPDVQTTSETLAEGVSDKSALSDVEPISLPSMKSTEAISTQEVSATPSDSTFQSNGTTYVVFDGTTMTSDEDKAPAPTAVTQPTSTQAPSDMYTELASTSASSTDTPVPVVQSAQKAENMALTSPTNAELNVVPSGTPILTNEQPESSLIVQSASQSPVSPSSAENEVVAGDRSSLPLTDTVEGDSSQEATTQKPDNWLSSTAGMISNFVKQVIDTENLDREADDEPAAPNVGSVSPLDHKGELSEASSESVRAQQSSDSHAAAPPDAPKEEANGTSSTLGEKSISLGSEGQADKVVSNPTNEATTSSVPTAVEKETGKPVESDHKKTEEVVTGTSPEISVENNPGTVVDATTSMDDAVVRAGGAEEQNVPENQSPANILELTASSTGENEIQQQPPVPNSQLGGEGESPLTKDATLPAQDAAHLPSSDPTATPQKLPDSTQAASSSMEEGPDTGSASGTASLGSSADVQVDKLQASGEGATSQVGMNGQAENGTEKQPASSPPAPVQQQQVEQMGSIVQSTSTAPQTMAVDGHQEAGRITTPATQRIHSGKIDVTVIEPPSHDESMTPGTPENKEGNSESSLVINDQQAQQQMQETTGHSGSSNGNSSLEVEHVGNAGSSASDTVLQEERSASTDTSATGTQNKENLNSLPLESKLEQADGINEEQVPATTPEGTWTAEKSPPGNNELPGQDFNNNNKEDFEDGNESQADNTVTDYSMSEEGQDLHDPSYHEDLEQETGQEEFGSSEDSSELMQDNGYSNEGEAAYYTVSDNEASPFEDKDYAESNDGMEASSAQPGPGYIEMLRTSLEMVISMIPDPLHTALEELSLKGISPRVTIFTAFAGILTLILISTGLVIQRGSKESFLKGKLCAQEGKVFKLSAENQVLKEDLLASKEKVLSLECSVEEVRSSLLPLEDQLKKSKSQSSKLHTSLQEMQDKMLVQQEAVQSLRADLARKENEISEEFSVRQKAEEELDSVRLRLLQCESQLLDAQEEASSQSQECSRVKSEKLQLEEAAKLQAAQARKLEKRLDEAQSQLDKSQERQKELDCLLQEKEDTIQTLTTAIKSVKTLKENSGTTEKFKDNLKALLDVSKVTVKLQKSEEANKNLENLLEMEKGRAATLESEFVRAEERSKSLESSHQVLLQEKLKAQTELEVLSNYFKETETRMQKELGAQEALRQQKEETASSADRKAAESQQEAELYRAQIKSLREELENTDRSNKNQVAALEKKVYENWVAARSAERKLEEAKQESAVLRQRLILLEKEVEATKNSTDSIIRPIPKRPAGSVSSETFLDEVPVDMSAAPVLGSSKGLGDLDLSKGRPVNFAPLPLPPMGLPPPPPFPPPLFGPVPPPPFMPPPFGDPHFVPLPPEPWKLPPHSFERGRRSPVSSRGPSSPPPYHSRNTSRQSSPPSSRRMDDYPDRPQRTFSPGSSSSSRDYRDNGSPSLDHPPPPHLYEIPPPMASRRGDGGYRGLPLPSHYSERGPPSLPPGLHSTSHLYTDTPPDVRRGGPDMRTSSPRPARTSSSPENRNGGPTTTV